MYQNQFYMQRQEILKVNGENGINALNLSPNSSVLALDTTQPIVWLAQTDGAGYKTVTPYKIEPYVPEPTPDYKMILERIAKIEERLNAESNTSKNADE